MVPNETCQFGVLSMILIILYTDAYLFIPSNLGFWTQI